MLREAGAAHESEQIGIPPERLRRSYHQAYHIRRRYTVLDLAEAGIGQSALDEVVADAVAIHRCDRAEIRSASAGLPSPTAARWRR